jgi:uncharacterized repeat protein (TIGR03803 family)
MPRKGAFLMKLPRLLHGSTRLVTIGFALLFPVIQTPAAQAQTYSVLYAFKNGTDGVAPYAGLVRDAAGNLYGTTLEGGDLTCLTPFGCGTIFKVDASGQETILHNFGGAGDGTNPSSSLISDAAGNLYGTTPYNGPSLNGAVFKLDTTGNYTVLYGFSGAGGDGAYPSSGLVLDAAGNLYGTTGAGGGTGCMSFGCGTVFKLDSAGNETVVYRFTGLGGDGALPASGLIRDAAGNLYGTTVEGGNLTGACLQEFSYSGCGTVFKVDAAGNETVLYRFTGVRGDGTQPHSGLVRDAAGNLYGTTSGGGAHGHGAVFKLDATGKETVLYSFAAGTDGAGPLAGLVRDARGNLFGTTNGGGGTGCLGAGCGTVFEVDTTGREKVLHRFAGADGGNPVGGLIRDAAGNLYGTTSQRGSTCPVYSTGCGTVFKIAP